MSAWPTLRLWVTEGPFTYLDFAFAKMLLPDTEREDVAIVFAYLMAASRMGHICITVDRPEISMVFLDKKIDKNKSILLREKLLSGWENLPENIVDKITDESRLPRQSVVLWNSHLYLQKNYFFETSVVKNLRRLQRVAPKPVSDKFLTSLQNLFEKGGLFPEQKEAALQSFYQSVSFICGGPGTGKTYTASRLIDLYTNCSDESFKIVLSAPTGKAATLLQRKVSGKIAATTLHALLGMNNKGNFIKTVIPFDLIVIDEASMIDISLMSYLLEAVLEGSRVVFLGDPDQLSPVEGGNVFSDIVAQEKKGCTILNCPIRFENEALGTFATYVRLAKEESILTLLEEQQSSLQVMATPISDKKVWLAKAFTYFPPPTDKKRDPKEVLQEMDAFRILSPLRQGPFGVETLNEALLQQYIPYGMWHYIPILLTENDNVKGLYNGMQGILIQKYTGKKNAREGVAYFWGPTEKLLEISGLQLPPFEWAYAITVHKSQGSEFDQVLLALPQGSESFGKEALYTAVTRAKKKLEIVGAHTTILNMLRNNGKKVSGLERKFCFLK